MNKQEIMERIKQCESVLPERTINGYYVKTILVKSLIDKEIIIKVLAVFKNENDTEILQYNVDVENLLGGLLISECYAPDELSCVADAVLNFIKIAKGENK